MATKDKMGAITYHDAMKDGVLNAVDFMNMAAVPSSYSKRSNAPPRPGTRVPEMSEDQLVDLLRRKLGKDFNAAMGVPVHQWGGEWKKSPAKLKARIGAVQKVYQDMKRLRMTTTEEDDGEDIVL